MSTRYATIITGNDGEEIVSNIAQIEGNPTQPRTGKIVKVADGVMIGMVRGGSVDAVGGFGFPKGSDGKAGRSPLTTKEASAPKDPEAPSEPAAKKPARAKKAA